MTESNDDDWSQPKRTRKAGTRRRSTSSSTTALPQRPPPLVGELVTEAAPFTPEEQSAFLGWMYRGGSPLAVCQQLESDIGRFWKTLETDAGFAAAIDQMYESLTLNVVAVLYRAAMQGNLTAVRLWLEHRPSVAWSRRVAANLSESDCGNLTNEEFKVFLRQEKLLEETRGFEGIPSS
jgi:hypothetical protein